MMYGAAADSADLPRQLYDVSPSLRGRAQFQPQVVMPAVGPAIDPALYVGPQAVPVEQPDVPLLAAAYPEPEEMVEMNRLATLAVMPGEAPMQEEVAGAETQPEYAEVSEDT